MSNYQHNPSSSRGAHARAHTSAPANNAAGSAWNNGPQAQPGAFRPAAQTSAYARDKYGSAASAKRGGGVWRVVFVVAIVVFVAAVAALGVIGYGYWHGQQNNKQLAQTGFNPPDAAQLQTADLASFTVDWDALRAINPDTVGWIYIPGTTINFPIVHTSDDEHYLKTDFYGETNWAVSFGAIFLSAANTADFSDANNVVYGHHMNDGSMFSPIADFADADTFNANRTVYIFTPQANWRLTTFSLVHCAADDPLAQTAFASESERQAYVQDKVDRSVVSVEGLPSAADMNHTFAFATCDNSASNGRWVLFAYVSDTVATAGSTAGAGNSVNPEDVAAVNEAAKETAA